MLHPTSQSYSCGYLDKPVNVGQATGVPLARSVENVVGKYVRRSGQVRITYHANMLNTNII